MDATLQQTMPIVTKFFITVCTISSPKTYQTGSTNVLTMKIFITKLFNNFKKIYQNNITISYLDFAPLLVS